jgi:crotonobetainyl-CoA:carnitine CoA-transferase CaiB-like acyl-CoA transferase
LNLQGSKRAMTFKLEDPRGPRTFKRLAENADAVVENFRPDVKTKLGIDYQSLRGINPGIVYGSISGFGRDGPIASAPGETPRVTVGAVYGRILGWLTSRPLGPPRYGRTSALFLELAPLLAPAPATIP